MAVERGGAQAARPGALDVARRAVDIAADRQALDILLLDVRGLCSYADAFVLLSAESKRQIEAIVAALDTGLTEAGSHLLHAEGETESGWVLMDFGDVIVHIFAPAERSFYGLEQLWRRASPLLRIQ
ncbi:MAG: ribosome silencing factor [Chloroflexi bacterium]|nr:ribosome silencing factor [Chloroflexota bacterium]